MRKKFFLTVFFAILSFFVVCMSLTVFSSEYTIPNTAKKPPLVMYMESVKVEPEGGIKSKNLTVTKGAETEALKLYDGKTDSAFDFDSDVTVTLDMGVEITFTGIRYYMSDVKDNNCFGTRFYASTDNKNYIELGTIEGTEPVQNAWDEMSFSGFGEYRYFRVVIPAHSNICEIEWMGTENFSKTKLQNGKSKVVISLVEGEAVKDTNALVLAGVFNKDGIMKQARVIKKTFKKSEYEKFDIDIDIENDELGDAYRVVVFDDSGKMLLPSPLNYRVNGASSDFSISAVFGTNMILQADKPLIVWGKAPKYRTVEVEIRNDKGGKISKSTTSDNNSSWEVNMGTFTAGGSYTMLVKCDCKLIEYKNITFGDVWICTGQSNMEYYMMAADETASALKNPQDIRNNKIRLFNLWNKGKGGATNPVDNPPYDGVYWHECDADTVSYCSAVGYYFAKEIEKSAGVPVGIINVAVGDTEINRWVAKNNSKGLFKSDSGDLYNNRIYPFSKLAIKGIILYQGEADQYRTHMSADEYSDAMACLVDSYRKIWGSDIPFYWAQLTRYKDDESEIRQGQLMTLSKVAVKKNTGMISLIDIFGRYEGGTGSCREDIHPWNKKTVGERFAYLAERDCYGKDVIANGPMYKSSSVSGNKLALAFDCSGVLKISPKEKYADKVTDDKIKSEKIDVNKPQEFEIAGTDKVFYPATATLDGKTVVLTSDKVKNPVYARYAWGAYPEMPNLTDSSGLPAPSFTTENLR